MHAGMLAFARPERTITEGRSFLEDVHDGLASRQKTLPAKHFYDLEGSILFDQITRLPEYYPTRTELRILRDRAADLARLCPARAAIVEFGAGSSEKIRVLLAALPEVAAYVPVDVSADFLATESGRLRADLPRLDVIPVVGDFSREIDLPGAVSGMPLVGFFPGSTIGNFEPDRAVSLLRRFAELLGPSAVLIVGVDLVKDDAVLNAAYNDQDGVTARFNVNVLARINRELGADFDLTAFEHRAFFNRERSRIEMHLVSRVSQTVSIGGRTFSFPPGSTIHTENSYKYTRDVFEALANRARWSVTQMFTDPDHLFGVFALHARR